mmetsp:Transcript_35578/g.84239  ORF Transcript_35578/g.84239 Transcript_35578/m.84239 type:complete len:154 (-) Transcript_35578:65-526(-)
MRVRMGDGLLSHGEGTVVEIGAGEEEDGTCSVIWDSDQCSTRAMHAKLGNKHECRVGKAECFDLVLADLEACPDLDVKVHTFVQGGQVRNHHEVIRRCALPISSAAPVSSETGSATEEAVSPTMDAAASGHDGPSLAASSSAAAGGEGSMEMD